MKINIKLIYLISFIVLLIVAVTNLWNLVIVWGNLTFPAKISTIFGGIVFQLLLSGIFFSLYRTIPKDPEVMFNNPELDKWVKNLEEGIVKKEEEK